MSRALAIAIVLLGGVAHAESLDKQVLRRVNTYRAAAGLSAIQLDAKLSAGCMEHAEYMRKNRDTDAMVGLNAHTQRPDLPGASPAGAACGKAADLFPGVSDLGVAVDAWMAGIYHRRPILDPTLAKIGVGYAKLPDGSYMAALMFVDGKDAGGWPVAYPADQATDVALEYGNEVPNPVPGGGKAGYPITLQFPAFDPVTAVRAKLVDDAGVAVPFYLSDPEHPATSFGQFGVVSLIPKRALAPQAHYTVSIDATWKGKRGTWHWSFSTVTLRAVDAADAAAITAAINVASRVRGTVAYGGMMNSETAFLMIGRADAKQMVSVLIPRAAWKQLAHGAKPDAWRGMTVEVEATPQLVQHKYINLPIATPDQLHVVR